MKECTTFDHTADVGLAGRADTPEELFEAMAEGLAELICPRGCVRARRKREIRLASEDLEAMVVDFLSRVMITILTDHFAVSEIRVLELHRPDSAPADAAVGRRPFEIVAELSGEPLDPARHEIATEVKAVTYHQLSVVRRGRQWVARVILDV